MRRPSLSLVAALLFPSVLAGGDEGKGCTPVTVTVKDWEDVAPQTVYVTTTIENVVEKWETDYVTVTTTEVELQTTTVVSTVEVTTTETEVRVETTTIVNAITETQVSTEVDTVATTVEGPTITVVNTAFETDFSTVTTTVVEEGPTVVVSDCPTSQSLTGLVLCPTRDVNPTYTPSKPLPTDYLWGCPPDTICTPPQVDCNFERSPPSIDYYCAPEECKPTPDLPDYVNLTWPTPTESDCAWRGPALGFFNLNPENFGLSYAIFDVFGQPVCEATTPVWGDSEWQDSKPPKGKPGKSRRGRRTNNPVARLVYRQFESAPPD